MLSCSCLTDWLLSLSLTHTSLSAAHKRPLYYAQSTDLVNTLTPRQEQLVHAGSMLQADQMMQFQQAQAAQMQQQQLLMQQQAQAGLPAAALPNPAMPSRQSSTTLRRARASTATRR